MKSVDFFKVFIKELINMVWSPFFIMLTVLGNTFIGLVSVIFYFLEKDQNPKLVHYVDALWWTFATATTTGYGDIVPVTYAGKIVGILLMLAGTALFSIYTALFAETILTSKSINKPRK